jgi:hypothetical protein
MLSARLLLPDIEYRGPDCVVGGGCHEVSAWMEVAMNEGVSREEALGLLGRFNPLHLPLSASRRSVHVPLVPWPWPAASQAGGKALAEFLAPAPYGRGVRTQLEMHSSITEKRYELTGQQVDGDV